MNVSSSITNPAKAFTFRDKVRPRAAPSHPPSCRPRGDGPRSGTVTQSGSGLVRLLNAIIESPVTGADQNLVQTLVLSEL